MVDPARNLPFSLAGEDVDPVREAFEAACFEAGSVAQAIGVGPHSRDGGRSAPAATWCASAAGHPLA